MHDPHFAPSCNCLRSTEKLKKKYACSVSYSRIDWERTQVTTSCKEYSKPCNQAILAASLFQAWRLQLQWLLRAKCCRFLAQFFSRCLSLYLGTRRQRKLKMLSVAEDSFNQTWTSTTLLYRCEQACRLTIDYNIHFNYSFISRMLVRVSNFVIFLWYSECNSKCLKIEKESLHFESVLVPIILFNLFQFRMTDFN